MGSEREGDGEVSSLVEGLPNIDFRLEVPLEGVLLVDGPGEFNGRFSWCGRDLEGEDKEDDELKS